MKKMKMRNNMGLFCCLFAVLVFFAAPQKVAAAANSQMDLTVGTTNDAAAGDTVTVQLIGSNNPGLSTFATKLAYDDTDLEYVGTTWAKSITDDSNNIEMVSPVTENNQQVLNISAIFSSTYSNNETIVTVTFKAKNAYTTMPVTLSVREVTDSDYDTVTVATVVDATAGQASSETQTTEDTQDPDGTEDVVINGEDTEADDASSTGNKNNTTKKNNSSKPQNTTKTSGSTGDKTDATPKTGAVDLRMVFGIAVVVFLGVAAVCMRVLGKKKE